MHTNCYGTRRNTFLSKIDWHIQKYKRRQDQKLCVLSALTELNNHPMTMTGSFYSELFRINTLLRN